MACLFTESRFEADTGSMTNNGLFTVPRQRCAGDRTDRVSVYLATTARRASAASRNPRLSVA
jgi:hypothetical protein